MASALGSLFRNDSWNFPVGSLARLHAGPPAGQGARGLYETARHPAGARRSLAQDDQLRQLRNGCGRRERGA